MGGLGESGSAGLSPKPSCKVLLKGRQRWVGGWRSGPVGGGDGGEASPRGGETEGTCHLMEAESWGGWALGGPGRSHADWAEGESAGVASGHRDLRSPPRLSQLPGLPVWDPSLPAASQPGGPPPPAPPPPILPSPRLPQPKQGNLRELLADGKITWLGKELYLSVPNSRRSRRVKS